MERNKWMQYILLSAGKKFRNKSSGMVYRHIPAHFEHCFNNQELCIYIYEYRVILTVNSDYLLEQH
jgi:hypothetical protein